MFSNLIFLTRIDIKRTFRDIRYVFFIIILPVIFYIMYNALFKSNELIDGVTWASYSMISLSAFGIIGNGITSFGTRISQEKSQGWYTFLKISPISENLYNLSRIISNIILSFIIFIIIFITSYIFYDVRTSVYKLILIATFLILGSFIFNLLGLLIGNLKTATQPIATMLYLILSFIGGLWMPVISMPQYIQVITKLTPTYNYANICWSILSGHHINMINIFVLLAYLLIFCILIKLFSFKEVVK